ncbi:MAG: tandem-95 repeat protein [Gammaproteobacteria bacterium]|nr:tandem-95 repeat protein [Gammaproteobacteria bacterium]
MRFKPTRPWGLFAALAFAGACVVSAAGADGPSGTSGEDSSSPGAATQALPYELEPGDVLVNAALGVIRESEDTIARNNWSAQLGVIKERPPTEPIEHLLASPQLGVLRGPGITAVDPDRLTVGAVGQTVTVSGFELDDVDTVAIAPPEDITLSGLQIAPDGQSLQFSADVDAGTQPGLRRVVLFDGSGTRIPKVDADVDQVLVAAPTPVIQSIEPILMPRGGDYELLIRGQNLRGLPIAQQNLDDPQPDVRITPTDGVALSEEATSNAEGTIVTTRLSVADTAPLGERLVQVETRSAISSDTPDASNTFSIVDGPLRAFRPLVSRPLGVERETPEQGDPRFLKSLPIGVVRGPVVLDFQPRSLLRGASATLTFQGQGLGDVSDVVLEPGDGVTVDSGSLTVSGDSVEIDVAVDSSAPLFDRRIRLLTPGGSLRAPGLLQIQSPPPEVHALTPTYLVRDGVARTIRIQGEHLAQSQGALVLPGDDLFVQDYTIESDTRATLTLLAEAGAAVGGRVVQILGINDDSSGNAEPGNTLHIIDRTSIWTPVASVPVGVTRTPEEPPESLPLFSGPVGVVRGRYADALTPATVVRGGQTFMTVQGEGLDAVTGAVVEAADGIALDNLQIDPDGTSLQFELTVAVDANAEKRRIVLETAGDPVPFVPPREGVFTVDDNDAEAPVTVPDTYDAVANRALSVSVADGLLDNDEGTGSPLFAVLRTLPANGSLALESDGSFTYTPDADFVGADQFEYSAGDDQAVGNAATVTLNVGERNDAVADAYSTADDTSLVVDAASGLLANDILEPGDTPTITLETMPTLGELTLQADGGFTYVPDGSTGTDTFSYRLEVPEGTSLPAEVTIDIGAVNDPPAAEDDFYVVTEGEQLDVSAADGVLDNDTDPDGDPLSAHFVSNPSQGSLSLQSDGSFVYTPPGGFAGVVQFQYEAVDDQGLADSATVTIDIEEAPPADTQGPTIAEVRYRGQPLSSGATLSQSGTVSVTAYDESGVASLQFTSEGALNATDSGGGSPFTAHWSLEAETDGPNTLTLTAVDTLGNSTTLDVPVDIQLAPPPAPEITSPASGLVTNQEALDVAGVAERASEVRIRRGGAALSDWVTTDNSGAFSVGVVLDEGANDFTAVARNNRGAVGPESPAVQVTLDTDAPDAPGAVSASARQAGEIRIAWQTGNPGNVYHVYRSSQPFDQLGQAAIVNDNPIESGQFIDLTPLDQRYYYRVVAESEAGNASAPSEMVDAVSDRAPPSATEILYSSDGAVDPDDGRYGPGQVSVDVSVSEPLLTTPFLSITPDGGVPMSVDLFQVEPLLYRGSFEITDATLSGTAWAVFSARDQVGNRGTQVDSGATIQIDTTGPDLQSLTVDPPSPIDNSTPASLAIDLELVEPVTGPDAPLLEYALSAEPDVWSPVDQLNEVSALAWEADLTLPETAGAFEAETLTFRWTAADDLGNAGDADQVANQFQVYQDELPPLAPPANIDAWPLPGGQVGLMWSEVENAAAYEVWRRQAGDSEFMPIERVFELDDIDQPPTDGDYEYTVVSVRQVNGQEAISGPGQVREVTTDSVPPGAPSALDLQLTGSGIVAQWQAPVPLDEEVTYNLYRSSEFPDIPVETLDPIQSDIPEPVALDADPVVGEHTYAVTAVDVAGNESEASEPQYLNFNLLPVSSLTIERFAEQAPVVSWSHDATTLAGFDVYAQSAGGAFKLNPELLTAPSFIDGGYSGGSRRYEVFAIDSNDQQSVGRDLLLPNVEFGVADQARIREGLINGVEVPVENLSGQTLTGLTARLDINGIEHRSQPVALEPGEAQALSVPVPGYPGLPQTASGQVYLEYQPEPNELARIGRDVSVPVENGGLVVTLMTETFTRGGAGRVRARIENPGSEEIEILTAQDNGGNPSPDMRLKLRDAEGNVLAVDPFNQYLGENVVTLPSGYTAARIPAGGSWTSNWQDVVIPVSAPDQVWVELEIDALYFAFGQGDDELQLPGLTARRATTLVDTSYYGELLTISPESSRGLDPISIEGRAVERATDEPMVDVPLNLVISSAGFERQVEVEAGDDGRFEYRFEPLPGEGGVYEVSVVHPAILDRPVQGTFTIERLAMNPVGDNLTMPYDTLRSIPVEITAGPGTSASNVRMAYLAEDQVDGSLIPDLSVNTDDSISQLEAGQSESLNVEIQAASGAPESGTLYLRLTSDEAEGEKQGLLPINFQFVAAEPALVPDPAQIGFGLAQGESRSEIVTLSNQGYSTAEAVSLQLLDADDNPAPSWISLGIDGSPGDIGIGEQLDVPITVSPPSDLPSESSQYSLLVTSANASGGEVPIQIAVTQSGEGAALFHARDIYTATFDENGDVIEGLAGARVRLQNEVVLGEIHEGYTNDVGELLLENVPAGQYLYRVSAPDHQAVNGRIQIQPEITVPESVFLSYNLVSVEWSVTETSIEDIYEIDLSAIFETNVPAAVVTTEPMHRTLPSMNAGDVFVTQFEMINHGLIQAQSLEVIPPPEDQYFRFELMSEIPAYLPAQESVIVPYRVIAKQDFPPDDGGAGGCFSYGTSFECPYGYECADGTEDDGFAQHVLSKFLGDSCGGSSTPYDQPGFDGSAGAGGWYNGGEGGSELGGSTCAPDCEGDDCCGSSGAGGGSGGGGGGGDGPGGGFGGGSGGGNPPPTVDGRG